MGPKEYSDVTFQLGLTQSLILLLFDCSYLLAGLSGGTRNPEAIAFVFSLLVAVLFNAAL